MADQNEDGEKSGWSGEDYGAIITAVGGVTIGALSAISGNKRAWQALNDKARLANEAQDFNNELALTQNYQDYYLQLTASQQAKAQVGIYTNVAGFVVIGVCFVGLAFLIKKIV